MGKIGFKNFRLDELTRPIAIIVILALFSVSLVANVSLAEDLMKRIEERGIIRIGFQLDVPPFSSFDKNTQQPKGFSVDMANQLVFYLSKRFGKTIRLQPVRLKADQRISKILDGYIDIEMGASTKNYSRERSVDFSLVYFASETTFMVNKKSRIKNARNLDNKRIVAGRGTTNLLLLEELTTSGAIKPAKILSYKTHKQALQALINGQADAYCADRVLLATKRLQTPDPENWFILEDSIGYEPYAFMIPENNSNFLDFVNDTIRWNLLTGKYFDVYEKWMGPLGMGPFKMSPSFKEYLNVISYPIPENWWK